MEAMRASLVLALCWNLDFSQIEVMNFCYWQSLDEAKYSIAGKAKKGQGVRWFARSKPG